MPAIDFTTVPWGRWLLDKHIDEKDPAAKPGLFVVKADWERDQPTD